MKQLGDTKAVRSLVKGMGIEVDKKRGNGTLRIPRQPSICLGASDLSVMEMTGAYTTFANNGIYNKPIFITRIEDKNGNKIYEEIIQDRVALNPSPNYVMIEMVRTVMNQGLPGFSGIKSDMGGKTGTTNDYVDGWFMGLTPDLVVGTWVGGDDRWIRFRDFTLRNRSKNGATLFRKIAQTTGKGPGGGLRCEFTLLSPARRHWDSIRL